ncbi:MAG: UDP-N-acetylmuramoyl-tripeptide--D-alanyl-D-alanine ligase [Patescibacteria group bacterium]|nr:UDP-N-acetylmuramoyl-tripeptide--D-alanyl-D-alanine ligase [Patescibacteria group bacterium]
MNIEKTILKRLEECDFKVSTDTRKDVTGSIYFALKGENFDGSVFIHEVIQKGALGAVTENHNIVGEDIYLVDDVLKTLQESARTYRKLFLVPILAIGGSNGKTTSRELIYEILKTKYQVHTSRENMNNHIGVPLSILAMDPKTEIGVFEIGANHLEEHTALLDILSPTLVVVTNNGLDHLEGFGSPQGVREANKEIYDWARKHRLPALVNKDHSDLMEDSLNLEIILYPVCELNISSLTPLVFEYESKKYITHLTGGYNIENIQLALAVGKQFDVDLKQALDAVCLYKPSSKRSQFIKLGHTNFILDCYNANPSSMRLSLESFYRSPISSRGVILGDMLELGQYSEDEHKKIVEYIMGQETDLVVFIGDNFKKALTGTKFEYQWFPDSVTARNWFREQDFIGFTFLLKGSRGVVLEKVVGL